MKIGGLQKTTLIDYPGKVATTVFLSGCNFRCGYCYNPELVLPEKAKKHPEISQEDFFRFLDSRKNLLDGVCVTGGEPTVNPELSWFLGEIKKRGFLVKLDTNGSHPETLENLFKKGLVDYVAMDIKAPLEKYEEVTGSKIDKEKIKKSIEIIKNSEIEYEFRTTLIPGVHGKEEVSKMGELIKGAKRYFLQNFMPEKTINNGFLEKKPFVVKDLENFRKEASFFVENCSIRE